MEIPESVIRIGDQVFDGCKALASVVIPASVTEIGYGAFRGCGSLETIEVASDNPSYCVKDGALYSKHQTILLRVPKTTSAFVIPDTVTEIGWCAFDGCEALASVVIPNSVTEIGNEAFRGCEALAGVVIP
ncbi:MAG: leucine-rich repeat domain-containing protein, partial [Thermoguttaceae bacterium]|nr:leucine-rich repeat domain-containing protein [Thermoguttaceae bacterium]